MWSKTNFSIIIWVLILLGTIRAQGFIDDPVLDSLVAKALKQNPDIQSATERVKAAEFMVTPAGALPDPMASVGLAGPLAGSWVGEPMAMPNVILGLSQRFPFPGKQGSMKGAAGNMASMQGQSLEDARLRLVSMVKSAYYDLAYWNDAMVTVLNNIAYIDELESVARERYKVGQGVQANVLRAQKMRTRLEDHKLMVEQMISTLQVKLARLVGDMSLDSVRARLPEMKSLPSQDREILMDFLAERNPRLKRSHFDIERRRDMLRKAKLDYLPDITLGAMYGIRRENEMFPMFSTDMLTITAGLNIPIWAGWKQKNLVSSARANLRQSEYSKQDLENELRFELDRTLLEYERNSSRYTLYKESLIPQSQAVLESSRAAYEVGKLEFFDVIDAQMELFNVELELQRSLADGLKSLAEIELLTGEPVLQEH